MELSSKLTLNLPFLSITHLGEITHNFVTAVKISYIYIAFSRFVIDSVFNKWFWKPDRLNPYE